MAAHQAPLSMGFSRQEHWSGLLFPSLRDLLNPGTEPRSPALQADSLPSGPPEFSLIWGGGGKRTTLPRLSKEVKGALCFFERFF